MSITFIQDDKEFIKTKHFFEFVDVSLSWGQFVFFSNGINILKGLNFHVI
jgi:hypothetical protein